MNSLRPLRILLYAALCAHLITSCTADETKKTAIQFDKNSLTIAEGQNGSVRLVLDKPSKKNQQVTLQLNSSVAEYGVDFIIAKVIFPEQEFVVTIPKDSSSITIPIYALADFDIEADEEFELKIASYSDGLEDGTITSTKVTLSNVKNFPDENRAISFDGVDDYIDMGNIYDDLQIPFSVSAWVWIDTSVPDDVLIPIFVTEDGADVYNGFTFATSTTSHIGITYGDGLGSNNVAYRRSKSSYFNNVKGRWVNMTAVVRGAIDMSLYLNGVEIPGEYVGSSDSPMGSNAPLKNAKIGIFHGNVGLIYSFVGKIDEVKVWNRDLSEAEVQVSIFNKSTSTEEGLIGYWDFDEPEGTTVYDRSANHFNGEIQNNATRVVSSSPVNP
jgi:hypothetical protein